MKIERELYPTQTLQDFAEQHGLVLKIVERDMDGWQRDRGLARFTAQFKYASVARAGLLQGAYGNGNTEDEAIAAYAKRISGERLIVEAIGADRTEIKVPRLTYSPAHTSEVTA